MGAGRARTPLGSSLSGLLAAAPGGFASVSPACRWGGHRSRRIIPYETIGTWTTKIARLPVTGGWHALVYTKTAEYGYEKDSFLLLAQSREEAPALHHRFLDKRSPLPLHGSWADWLWQRGLDNGEIVPPTVRWHLGLPVLPQGRQAPRRSLRRRGVGLAHPAH